jgi:hypothetical protein
LTELHHNYPNYFAEGNFGKNINKNVINPRLGLRLLAVSVKMTINYLQYIIFYIHNKTNRFRGTIRDERRVHVRRKRWGRHKRHEPNRDGQPRRERHKQRERERSGGHNRSGGYYGGGVGHKTWMLISYDSTTGSYGRNGTAVGAHNSGSATGALQDFGRGGGKEASIGTGQSGEKGDNLELQFNYVLIV